MYRLSAHTIIEIVSGRLVAGDEGACADSCTIDSREAHAGSLFAAFVGESRNAHEYISKVLEAGTTIVLVTQEDDYEALLRGLEQDALRAIIMVDDMLTAVQDLARHQRSILNDEVLVVAITGSTGKTSTKEFCAAALAATLGETVSTEGNQNNELGVPLTLLKVNKNTKALIVEMGMRARGEIKFLSQIARPHAAIITGAGSAHQEILGSLEEIAHAKAEVFSGLEGHRGRFADQLPLGCGIVPCADSFLELFCASCKAPSYSVGFADECSSPANFLIENLSFDSEVCGSATMLLPEPVRLQSAMPGKHHVLNQGFVLALVSLIGIDVEQAALAMAETLLSGMRYKKEQFLISGVTIINDAYNANPTSMAGALATFSLEEATRKIAVLGDMRELGDGAQIAHQDIGKLAARSGITALYAIGEYAPVLVSAAKLAGIEQAYAYELDTIDKLCEDLSSYIQAGDSILLKGSRALALERVIEKLGLR